MRKLIGLIFFIAVLGFVAGPVLAGKGGAAGKSNTGHVYLYEKDGSWVIVSGGAWGKMRYDVAGEAFDFVFNGHKLGIGVEYTLVYAPDPWELANECLGEGIGNEDGNVHIAASPTPGNMPSAEDSNSGAKIWLVLSSDIDCSTGVFSAWNPADYLFENNLISYTEE